MQRTSLRFARSPLTPTVRLAYAPASWSGSLTACRSDSSSRQLLGSTISVRRRPYLRPVGRVSPRGPAPPPRAFVVRQTSPVSATARRAGSLHAFGSSSLYIGGFHRTGCGRLTSVNHRVPALPSFRPRRLSQASTKRSTPANHPGAPALGSFIGRTHPRPNPHRSGASLTPACSGLATLATDARR